MLGHFIKTGGGVDEQLMLGCSTRKQEQLGRGSASKAGLEMLPKLEPDKDSLF
jgi:hypothetical protein